MAQVFVKYNPYRLETEIKINGKKLPTDSGLYKVTKGKRLQEWVGKLPEMLRKECNAVEFSLEFNGMELDWDDFKEAFSQAEKKGIVKVSGMRFLAGKRDEEITQKIVSVFQDLQEGPVEEFRDEKLIRIFESVNNAIFPINVIATMSSGKSTLINSLLGNKLMPSKNAACTATITEILDTDSDVFAAVAYDKEDNEVGRTDSLTYEVMSDWNDKDEVQRILAEGNIPFLDSRNTALMLVDTPGPNNSQNQAHKNTTYMAINRDSNNLILYVLNGTQLSTNDDAALLRYVAEQIQKGGKQARDRFLFVINKMDQFNPEEESIEGVMKSARAYLASYGIEDPQIFPCSAFLALNIRTHLAGVDIDNLTRAQERALPVSAQDAINMVYKFTCYESMHLERYSTLSPSAQQALDYRLKLAVEHGDTKEQAMIHSGIYSIEAAITAYVKKYARTKKVKDLVESFMEVLESNRVLAKAKAQVATDAEAAEACAKRARAVREKIADGEEARAFKAKVEALDPMPAIKNKAAELEEMAAKTAAKVFGQYGDMITNREEAKRLVKQFSMSSSDAMAQMTSELESEINTKVVETGERLLVEYQAKLSQFDEDADEGALDFQTVDLIKGRLKAMQENAEAWTTDDFAASAIDDMGETSIEERRYYEKVGQEAEEVIVGSHQEQIGTEKVKVGSHRKKVGTRQVRNPEKKWWKIFTPRYVDEDVYEMVDDYEDRAVYTTVMDYKTVMRDIMEERVERIEKFHVSVSDIQIAMVAMMRLNLHEGIEGALVFADQQVVKMKQQFMLLFDELDALIGEKYAELEKYAADETEKKQALEYNQKILDWINDNMKQIDQFLEL